MSVLWVVSLRVQLPRNVKEYWKTSYYWWFYDILTIIVPCLLFLFIVTDKPKKKKKSLKPKISKQQNVWWWFDAYLSCHTFWDKSVSQDLQFFQISGSSEITVVYYYYYCCCFVCWHFCLSLQTPAKTCKCIAVHKLKKKKKKSYLTV